MKKTKNKPCCIVGGIIKHKDGIGFKISFSNAALACKYKDMFTWIVKDDKVSVDVKKGYYDKKE